MVKVASLLSQILGEFPRSQFQRLVHERGAERRSKGFTCWAQFVAMLFCQLAGADSLREISNGLRCCLGKMRHLGLRKAPGRSTLAYANRHRPWELFQDLFFATYRRFEERGQLHCRKSKFRFKNKLLSIDSTTISLALSIFPWARFRRAKGGVKVHMGLDHDTYLPCFANISAAKVHDIKGIKGFSPNPGSIVAMDRAYVDFSLFDRWTRQGVYFVTRFKENLLYRVIETLPLPKKRPGCVRADELIALSGPRSPECPHNLRRITIWDELNKREIVLLTNHLEFAASTVADIYKDRWEIELFFKILKGLLRIKSFVGESENAVRIQIWTALIGALILKWLHHLSKAGWSLSNLAAMLRLNLFSYRDLRDWLNKPWETEPLLPKEVQPQLPFS